MTTDLTPGPVKCILYGGPGEGTIISVDAPPEVLYFQVNAGSSPYYMRGDVRVAVPALLPVHVYVQGIDWKDELEGTGYDCYYQWKGPIKPP